MNPASTLGSPGQADTGTEAAASRTSVVPDKRPSSSFSVRLLPGPLSLADRTRILSEYNRATRNRVPVQQFRRWTEQSPSGAALHAVLETKDGRFAGHCAAVPFPLKGPAGRVTAAKLHYFFLSAESPWRPAQDFGADKKAAATALLEPLYRGASQQGWQLILTCVPPNLDSVYTAIGCRPVDFRVRDCFFILHPGRTLAGTGQLDFRKRVSWFAASTASWAYACCVSPFQRTPGLVQRLRIGDNFEAFRQPGSRHLALSDDPAFLCWRYPESIYTPLVVNGGADGYVIATKGTPFTFVRVAASQTPSPRSIPALIDKLIRHARSARALGIRWSVYGNGAEQDRLVTELRKRTFLCIHGSRRVLTFSSGSEPSSPSDWDLCDAFFTFDF